MKDEKIAIFIKETMKLAPDLRKNFVPPQCGQMKLSAHQLFCLMIIDKKGTLSMSDLALRLGVSNQQLTRIVDALVENNLVERFNDAENRRLVQARISASGKTHLEEMEKIHNKRVANLLSELSEQELDECIFHMKSLVGILTKILHNH